MKDIERRLGQHAPAEPRRPLSSTFTADTMRRIADRTRPSLSTRIASVIQGVPTMHKFTKPAALAIGLAVLAVTAVGTGYAALQWLQPHSTVDTNSITVLPNGNTRFWIHHDSCQGQDSDSPSNGYYEIKAGSKVTPEDLRKGIEAGCEDDLLQELFPETLKSAAVADFKPGDKQYQFPYVKIKAIGKDYIIAQGTYNGKRYPDARLPIDSHAKFYSKGQDISLQDFHPGDWVTMVNYTTELDRPFATETLHPDELEPLIENGFPRGTRIEGMIKRQYNPETTVQLMGVMGEDWTRLVEDKKSPDGWKQLVPFDHNWEHYNN
jgi:hypothetical protein